MVVQNGLCRWNVYILRHNYAVALVDKNSIVMNVECVVCPDCGCEVVYVPPTLYHDRKILTSYRCRTCGYIFCVEEGLC